MKENEKHYNMQNIVEGKENLQTDATYQAHNIQTTALICATDLISFHIQWNHGISIMKQILKSYKITVRILL